MSSFCACSSTSQVQRGAPPVFKWLVTISKLWSYLYVARCVCVSGILLLLGIKHEPSKGANRCTMVLLEFLLVGNPNHCFLLFTVQRKQPWFFLRGFFFLICCIRFRRARAYPWFDRVRQTQMKLIMLVIFLVRCSRNRTVIMQPCTSKVLPDPKGSPLFVFLIRRQVVQGYSSVLCLLSGFFLYNVWNLGPSRNSMLARHVVKFPPVPPCRRLPRQPTCDKSVPAFFFSPSCFEWSCEARRSLSFSF